MSVAAPAKSTAAKKATTEKSTVNVTVSLFAGPSRKVSVPAGTTISRAVAIAAEETGATLGTGVSYVRNGEATQGRNKVAEGDVLSATKKVSNG